jgi:hypothetical protein
MVSSLYWFNVFEDSFYWEFSAAEFIRSLFTSEVMAMGADPCPHDPDMGIFCQGHVLMAGGHGYFSTMK